MTAHVTQNLANGCSGNLILFEINMPVGIFLQAVQWFEMHQLKAIKADK